MRIAILIPAALLAGCGGQGSSTTVTHDGSKTTVTSDGSKVTVESNGAKLTTGTGAGIECANKPDFAPVYAGSTILTCVSGGTQDGKRESGSVFYSNPAAAAAILAWSKAEVVKAGFEPRLETQQMFSATNGDQRSIMVMVNPKDSGTEVSVSWGISPN